MSDLISRTMVIEAIMDHVREKFAQRDTPLNYINGLYQAEDIIETLPSAQTSLIEAVKIIEDFLHGCHDSLTSELVTPDGIKLRTDWGYFEGGLEEIKLYAERRA